MKLHLIKCMKTTFLLSALNNCTYICQGILKRGYKV